MRKFYVLAFVRLCLVGVVAAVCSVSSVAQEGRGSITGTVTDQQGKAIPGVTVNLLDSAAKARLQHTATNDTGAFTFSSIASGTYVIEIERSGFSKSNTTVNVTDRTETNVSVELKVAGPGQQITVTAQAGSFRTEDTSIATKIKIPISEIPQGVGVVDQALIQSQQDIQFASAAENISGVNRDVYSAGSLGNAVTIRGLPLSVFSNYYRDGFVFDGMAPSDTTDVERVEVLKGPSSVLYGRAAAGGIVNLVTKQPLPETHVDLSVQADRFGSVRPTVDVTGPLGSSGKLFYRLNFEYANYSNFRDYFGERRFFVAPAVTWTPDKATTISFLFEYLDARTTTDYGIPSLGNRPAPVPISNFYGEPWQYATAQNPWGSVNFSRNLNSHWTLRSGFRAMSYDWYYLDVSTGYLLPDNETLTRYSENANYPLNFYDWQIDLTGTFKTGPISHNFLVGFELGSQSVVQDAIFSDAPPINLYNPVPFSRTLPDPTTLTNEFFNPSSPDYFPLNGTTKLTTHGGYLQDQITLLPSLKVLAGVRFEGYTQRYDEIIYDTHNRQDNVSTLPRIGVTYQPFQLFTFYGSWSHSFCPTLAAQFTPGGEPFPPESSNQYEFGVRSNWWHGRLSSSLSFYKIRATNLLVTNPGNPLASIQIGTTDSKGIEFDTSGQILPGWNITFAYAYNEARIAQDPVYPVGNIFQNAPRNSGNLWTVYDVQHGPLTGLSFGGGFRAVSYRFVDPSNDVVLPGYGRLDAMAAYAFGPERRDQKLYKISVNLENLTNRSYYASGNSPSTIFPGSPINVLSRFEVRF